MSNFDVEKCAQALADIVPGTDSNNWPFRNEILFGSDSPQPELWADICRRAIELNNQLYRSTLHQAWLMIECINGIRRQNGKWGIDLAANMLNEAISLIIEVTDKKQKERLFSLYLYHSAQVYHVTGEFGKAAGRHNLAAKTQSDEFLKRQSLYNAVMEHLNRSLIEESDPKSALQCYLDYVFSFGRLLEVLLNENNEQLRWKANIFCQMIFYCWLKEVEPLPEYISFLENLSPEIVPAVVDARQVVQAIRYITTHKKADLEKAIEVCQAECHESYWKGLTLFVLARAFLLLGNRKKALAVYEQIILLGEKEHGQHLAISLANQGKRELEG